MSKAQKIEEVIHNLFDNNPSLEAIIETRDKLTIENSLPELIQKAPHNEIFHISERILKKYSRYLGSNKDEGKKLSFAEFLNLNKEKFFSDSKDEASLIAAFLRASAKKHREGMIEAQVLSFTLNREMEEEYYQYYMKEKHPYVRGAAAVGDFLTNRLQGVATTLRGGEPLRLPKDKYLPEAIADKKTLEEFKRLKAAEAVDNTLPSKEFYMPYYEAYKKSVLEAEEVTAKFTEITLGVKYEREVLETILGEEVDRAAVIGHGYSLAGGSLAGTIFDQVTANRLDLSDVDMKNTTGTIAFEDCSLQNSDFRTADTVRMSFQNCSTLGAKFGTYTIVAQNKKFRDLDRATDREHVVVDGAEVRFHATLGPVYSGSDDGDCELESIDVDIAYAAGAEELCQVEISDLEYYLDHYKDKYSFVQYIRGFKFVDEGRKIMPSLRNEDLRPLGEKLKDADLSGTDLSGANLSGMDLTGIKLEGCNLERTNFIGSTLLRANLRKVVAVLANLSFAKLEGAYMEDGNFDLAVCENGKFSDVHAARIKGRYTSADRLEAERADFSYADLEGATLRAANLKKAKFIAANLSRVIAEKADFTEAEMESVIADKMIAVGADFTEVKAKAMSAVGADFSHATLHEIKAQYANFDHAKMREVLAQKADFTGAFMRFMEAEKINMEQAIISFADLRFAKLKEATLIKAQAMGIDARDVDFTSIEAKEVEFKKAMMDRANLMFAKMKEARMDETSLAAANLYKADLEKAIFAKTIIKRAILSHANARKAKFTAAIIDRETRLEGMEVDQETEMTPEMTAQKQTQEMANYLAAKRMLIMGAACALAVVTLPMIASFATSMMLLGMISKPLTMLNITLLSVASLVACDKMLLEGKIAKSIKSTVEVLQIVPNAVKSLICLKNGDIDKAAAYALKVSSILQKFLPNKALFSDFLRASPPKEDKVVQGMQESILAYSLAATEGNGRRSIAIAKEESENLYTARERERSYAAQDQLVRTL